MALSGEMYSDTGTNCNLKITWNASQNINTNQSTIIMNAYLLHNSLYCSSKSLVFTCDGQTKEIATPAISIDGNDNQTYLGSSSFTVTHTADGTKLVEMNATMHLNITYSGSWLGDIGCICGAQLDTIARASQPSCITYPDTVTSNSITYQVSSGGTTPPTGTWKTTVQTAGAGQYLWTKTVVTYSDGKSTTSYSISRNGTNGANGADALNLVISSSGGTALTALGTIKWYKDGGTTAVATGTTYTISSGDVTNKATYTAQLEG